MRQKGDNQIQIGFFLAPGMLSTGTALPYEMWLAAQDLCLVRKRRVRIKLKLIETCSEPSGRRLALKSDCSFGTVPQLDILYLPALWRNPRTVMNRMEPEFWETLRLQHNGGAQIASVGTGVSLLAESGLLNGKAATTHWYYFDQFEKDFPDVRLKKNFFITQSGLLHCAASINSLADVTVHLIERVLDKSVARHVEKNFSHEIRRTYEEYRYLDGGNTSLDDEVVLEAQLWISDHLAARQTIDELADRLGVAIRTLNRRFRQATGMSVRKYWQSKRVTLAKELLEKTNLTISEVAWRVGYQDAGYFSRLFGRELSMTPLAYRRMVRAKLFRA
jgi:transcriptional regulator GlxA family with amidase domain